MKYCISHLTDILHTLNRLTSDSISSKKVLFSSNGGVAKTVNLHRIATFDQHSPPVWSTSFVFLAIAKTPILVNLSLWVR